MGDILERQKNNRDRSGTGDSPHEIVSDQGDQDDPHGQHPGSNLSLPPSQAMKNPLATQALRALSRYSFQFGTKFVDRLVASHGVFRYRPLDDLIQPRRDLRPNLRREFRIFVQDPVCHCLLVCPCEGMLSGEHLVYHNPHRPNVCSLIRGFAVSLFGRHVRRRAKGRPFPGHQGPPTQLCQAKIHNLGHATGGDQDVGRLDVAVDNAVLVSRGEALCHLNGDVNCFIDRERTPLDLPCERLAFKILHADEHLTIGGFVDVMNDADIGVLEG